MNKINWFWTCEFIDNEGNSEWKILSASTPLGAKKRAFEAAFKSGLDPKYETIRPCTKKEISDFKKKIKERIKNNE